MRAIRSRSTLYTVRVAFLAIALSSTAVAQDVEAAIALTARQSQLDRLAPAETSGMAPFPLDASGSIRVHIIATRDDLTTSVEAPSGDILDETNIDTHGGEFLCFQGAETADSPVILPMTQPGHHYIFDFPSLGPGTYIVHFDADPNLAEEVAVITEVMTDSPVRVALFATESVVAHLDPVVFSAAVFEDAQPVVDASVSLAVKPIDFPDPETILTLLDDGIGADHLAGDGLYSSIFTTARVGPHYAVAEISGVRSDGTPFERLAATQIRAVLPRATLAGGVSDAGRDDNGNGLFEAVEVSMLLDVNRAKTYVLDVFLETAGGTLLFGTGQASLAVGSQTITARVPAAAFLNAGENGPYTILRIELSRFHPTLGVVPIDREVFDGSLQTQAYLLSQFERPAIELTGDLSDSGIDDDADGDFDTLRVLAGVKVIAAGTYGFTAELADGCNREMAYATGEQTLQADQLEFLQIDFDGSRIGPVGVAGPYQIRNLTIYQVGPGGSSLIVLSVGQTQAYAAPQFDGFGGNEDCNANGMPDDCECLGDIDGDGDVDLSDQAMLLAAFGSCAGDPIFKPAADLNGNGCIDISDLACILLRFGSTCG